MAVFDYNHLDDSVFKNCECTDLILFDLRSSCYWIFSENKAEFFKSFAEDLGLKEEEWAVCELVDMPFKNGRMPFYASA